MTISAVTNLILLKDEILFRIHGVRIGWQEFAWDLRATITARDEEIARLRGVITDQQQRIDTGVCSWDDHARVAQLEAAMPIIHGALVYITHCVTCDAYEQHVACTCGMSEALRRAVNAIDRDKQ